ncbi:MAG: HDIG domain-containing metalloprotein [Planctomycetota bacterium]
MANGKSSTARRREVRRNLHKPTAAWRDLLSRREVAWAALFVLGFTAIASLIAFPMLDSQRPLEAGQLAVKPIVSRVGFEIIDEDATLLDRRQRAGAVLPQFELNEPLKRKIESELSLLPAIVRDAETYADLDVQTRTELGLTEEIFDELKRNIDTVTGEPTALWRTNTAEAVRSLFDTAIITQEDLLSAKRLTGEPTRLTFTHPDPREASVATRVKQGRGIITLQDDERVRAELAAILHRFRAPLRALMVDQLMSLIGPTYTYSETDTAAAQQQAADSVQPRRIELPAGRVLVAMGDELTTEQLALVEAEHQAYLDTRSTREAWFPRLGLLGLILMIATGMWAYFFVYAPRIVANPMRGLAITGLMLLCLAASITTAAIKPEFTVLAFTFPALFASVVLAIAYDQRFALAMGVILALLEGITLRMPLSSTLIVVAGLGVAVMQLRDIRSRSKLVIVGIYAGLAMAGAATIVGFATRPVHLEGLPWLIFIDAGLAFFSGFLAGLVVQGILPLIERAFNVTTAMTLKELNDASHPLLKQLAQESPGTYQHSLRIADMAETAADTIGADGLLCRVGAMYHDVGKTIKPMYFIENQAGGPNKHNKLTPAMSLLIIVGHVKDGVAMAREFGLPPVIRHFIESHHGTTLVEYFYAEAKKRTEQDDQPEPSEFEYRYPGPKPKTKEAAILMICDAVEGAARAMDDPNASRLETLVKTMSNKRLMDGQFDDCNLTLQDLSRIEQAVTKSLCAMYHSRIKYPEDEKTQIIDMKAVHQRRTTAG